MPMTKHSSIAENEQKLGKKVWKKLNTKLPQASKITKKDNLRKKQFSKQLDKLCMKEVKALKLWLEQQIHDLKYCFPDLCTSSEEKYQRKWLQIYSEHLQILNSKTP